MGKSFPEGQPIPNFVAQIISAFKEEGYTIPIGLEYARRGAHSLLPMGASYAPQLKLTGKEWYERFNENMLDAMANQQKRPVSVYVFSPDEIDKAAKKATGLTE